MYYPKGIAAVSVNVNLLSLSAFMQVWVISLIQPSEADLTISMASYSRDGCSSSWKVPYSFWREVSWIYNEINLGKEFSDKPNPKKR